MKEKVQTEPPARSSLPRTLKIALLAVGFGGLVGLALWWWQAEYGLRSYVVPDPSQAQFIELRARPEDREGIYALELIFAGRLTGEIVLQIGFEGTPDYARKRIMPGEVNTRFESEWYHDHCLIRYRPEEDVEGHLEIQYQFIHL